MVACGGNDHHETPTGPSHYDERTVDVERLVVVRPNGLYEASQTDPAAPVTLCLWIPWPLVEGETLPRCADTVTVTAVGETMTYPAGTFDGVATIRFDSSEYIDYDFRPGSWILSHFATSLRGGLGWSLTAYDLRLSGATERDRYGLGDGSRYTYEYHGSDSLGYAYSGGFTATITGEREVNGEVAIVVHEKGVLYVDPPGSNPR